MRIVIFGTGGIGGYFGARLAQSNNDVVFIARGEHLRAIREHGLTVESIDGDFVINPAQATDDVTDLAAPDLIIIGVKAWQVSEAARTIKPIVGPSTTVLPLQNGVDAPAQLIDELGAPPVIAGLCRIVTYIAAPGRIRHAGFEPSVAIGELDNRRSARIEEILKTFTHAGIKTNIPADIHAALWAKFLFISAYSGVGALTGKAAHELRTDAESRALLEQAMQEVYSLARARGISLPADAVEKALASVDSLPAGGTSSMQRDIAAGRPSELESQNGAVVRMARELNVAVPAHEMIYASLKPLEVKARTA